MKLSPGMIAESVDNDLRGTNHMNFGSQDECQCLICGKMLGMLTHCHAEKHGYKDKYAIIKAGKVRFLNKRKYGKTED